MGSASVFEVTFHKLWKLVSPLDLSCCSSCTKTLTGLIHSLNRDYMQSPVLNTVAHEEMSEILLFIWELLVDWRRWNPRKSRVWLVLWQESKELAQHFVVRPQLTSPIYKTFSGNNMSEFKLIINWNVDLLKTKQMVDSFVLLLASVLLVFLISVIQW